MSQLQNIIICYQTRYTIYWRKKNQLVSVRSTHILHVFITDLSGFFFHFWVKTSLDVFGKHSTWNMLIPNVFFLYGSSWSTFEHSRYTITVYEYALNRSFSLLHRDCHFISLVLLDNIFYTYPCFSWCFVLSWLLMAKLKSFKYILNPLKLTALSKMLTKWKLSFFWRRLMH